MDSGKLSLSSAIDIDQDRLADFFISAELIHRHLDWWEPSIWVNVPHFYVLVQDKKVVAGMACPEYPAGVSWVRFFGVLRARDAIPSWRTLWTKVSHGLQQAGIMFSYAIPLDVRCRYVLENSKGIIVNNVVNLTRISGHPIHVNPISNVRIRQMDLLELPEVTDIDNRCFDAIWRNSLDELTTAYNHACSATVAEFNNEIIGYQVTTQSHTGCHLARLAVLPNYQGKGVGKLIVCQLITELLMRGIKQLTVNTQEDNYASLALYQKTGFILTGSSYPVYRIPVLTAG